jgi:hypothetical protein
VAEAHPDQDGDGFVSVADIHAVVAAFGQEVPSPTPQPSAAGRLQPLFDAEPISGAWVSSGYVNTDGCSIYSLYYEIDTDVSDLEVEIIPSLDGATAWANPTPWTYGLLPVEPGRRYARRIDELVSPFLEFRARASKSFTRLTAWLYCT